jgi:DNA polymerase-1
MIRVHGRLAEDGIPARMLLTVHDELVFEVEEGAVDPLAELVRREMESAIELDVPVEVGIGVGPTWYDAK